MAVILDNRVRAALGRHSRELCHWKTGTARTSAQTQGAGSMYPDAESFHSSSPRHVSTTGINAVRVVAPALRA